jgi:peptidoglycan/xylan/chitin deacetylase (PgdA/CDA1 family)
MAILAFHDITDNFTIGINNYSPKRLRRLIIYLQNNNYKIVSLTDYISDIDNPRLVALTFDDGYQSFYESAFPILMEKSLPATVFIPFNFIGKTNSWDYGHILQKTKHLESNQIKEISDCGIDIGSHGYSHIALSGLTDRFLKLELTNSKKGLEDLTGSSVNYISYPFGLFDAKTEALAIDLGYRRGLSLSYLKRSRTGFSIPRHAIYSIDNAISISAKLHSGFFGGIEKLKGSIINNYAGGTVLFNKIRRQNYPILR